MLNLVTTLGLRGLDKVKYILPHEHLFANFIDGRDMNVSPDDVVKKLGSEIIRARDAGISAIVDATAIGGARRIDIIQAVSQAYDMPVVVATGIFKEPWKADLVKEKGEDGLADWMIRELTEGIDETDTRAGWIKLSVADDGLADHEVTLLRAAARAGIETGATIGVHTVRGSVALDQLDIIESVGYRPDRFIWIHTQVEADFRLHLEVARRGAWIEYDAIGVDRDDAEYLHLIQKVLDAGYEKQLLLSHDRNGYNPLQPKGGTIEPYTTLFDTLMPKLSALGVDAITIDQLTRINPFLAYAR